ncbi:uncharacterized protein LOC143563862 [Bidens hawaiensis]|uniref:uncharacterized protein LOC143563862 n=1 Tax=Bidens hawaiensis TaxID=980011 RepID=UPI004049482E
MKQQADKHRSERELLVGSWAYLKLHPYMQNTGHLRKHSKLTPKYFGPYLILEKMGKVAYKLDLPTTVVPIPGDSRFHLLPEAIIDRRMVQHGHRATLSVLVKWQGKDSEDATWEFMDDLQLRFLDFTP